MKKTLSDEECRTLLAAHRYKPNDAGLIALIRDAYRMGVDK